jgi:hypothetical protein
MQSKNKYASVGEIMMCKPCPHSPIQPKFQREYFRKKRVECGEAVLFMGNLSLRQQLKWMLRGAKDPKASPDVRFKIMKHMTDAIPDRACLASQRGSE